MFVNTKLLVLLASAGSALAHGASTAQTLKFTDSRSPTIIPGRYIIAVGGSNTLTKRDSAVEISGVISKIGGSGIDVETRKLFQSPGLLTGASIVVPDNTTTEDLLAIPGVTHAWPVQSIPNPHSLQTSPINGDTSSSQLVRRELLERRTNDFKKDNFPPHQMTGVDKLHAKGYLGTGMRVLVIDSGVDYKNPILGGCFGKGCKVGFGYSFIDNDGKPIGKPDPYVNCTEHGTHVLLVMGTIGANPNKYGFTGVVPKATLGMYRVFGCAAATSDDIIVEALLRAPQDKPDVISMSLGGPGGWSDSGAQEYVVNKLIAKGIHVVAAAGNEQIEGMFFASDPSSARNAMSIASVDVTVVPAYSMVFKTGGHPSIVAYSAKPLGLDKGLPVYFTSTDLSVTNDACDKLPKSTPDLKDRVVFIRRGTCRLNLKIFNAGTKGARYVVLYGAPGQERRPYFSVSDLAQGTSVIGIVGMSAADAAKVRKYYLAQKKKGPKVAFPSNSKQLRVQQTLSGGQVSDFSQFGPTNDMYGQPSFGAPGGNVLSTFPLAMGGVGVISGTSMATPYTAGSVALILAARKKDKFSPLQMRQLLSSTAKAIPVKRNTKGPLTSTLLQGAGLIQVNKAVTAKSFFGPNELYLNDTTYFASMQTVTITNKNSRAVTYRYSDTGAQPRLTYDKKGQYNPSLEPPALKRGASVTFRPGRVTVPAGKTTTFQIKFQPPQFSAGQVALFPVYSGFIMITADNKESFQIPYFGMAGSMRDMQILDQTDKYAGQYEPGLKYSFLINSEAVVQTSPTDVATYFMEDGVTLAFRLSQATRAYTIDLMAANTTFKGTISTANNAGILRRSAGEFDVGSLDTEALASSQLFPRKEGKKYASVSTLGYVKGATNVPRDPASTSNGKFPFGDQQITFTGRYQTSATSGRFATAAKETPYRLLLRVVRTTANPADESSWESWLSPPFQFA
ncbi:BQ2448_5960 [Microbotryum intermedium]|uniref:BQ2448_5960 protein n=1 Tax=Microbotryum intermedium TaxID=269621 RepID=A0A238F634_9BASI|nr:BQ2448_5960 [Microbotryum intermedium]